MADNLLEDKNLNDKVNLGTVVHPVIRAKNTLTISSPNLQNTFLGMTLNYIQH